MAERERRRTRQVKDGFMEYSKAKPNILPSPAMLESYEEIAPGSVERLMEMAQVEQKHRHKRENIYLRSVTYTARIGQILGFALAAILIYTTILFAYDEHLFLSAVVCVSGFTFLTIAYLIAYKMDTNRQPKKHGSHKFSKKYRKRRN